jgi:hypothetical protein
MRRLAAADQRGTDRFIVLCGCITKALRARFLALKDRVAVGMENGRHPQRDDGTGCRLMGKVTVLKR